MKESIPENLDLEALRNKINSAINEAPSLEEFKRQENEEDKLALKLNKQQIKSQQYIEEQKSIPQLPGSVTFNNLPEFIQAMRIIGNRIGLSDEVISNIIEHENDHHNKAEFHKLKASYEVQFIKSGDEILIKPNVCFSIPKDKSGEETASICRDVIEAPRELSPSDKAKTYPGK